jgi:hypothetical protein
MPSASCPQGSFEKLWALCIDEGTLPQQLKMSHLLQQKDHIDLLLVESSK